MTSNTSNTSNTGNIGNSPVAGSGDPGGGWTFADRASLPFVDDPYIEPAPVAPTAGGFSDREWSPVWSAWRFLGEFLKLPWDTEIAISAPDLGNTVKEIGLLQEMARFERADALGEILAQQNEFISYFMAIMGATTVGHPNTYRLAHFANLVGTFMAMHFKSKHLRERPSMLAPSLLPPTQVPGHPAYPSGHATQAHLIAKCFQLLLPISHRPVKERTLIGLALRIARNREIAGLHYPSDTQAGIDLANQTFVKMEEDRALTNPRMPLYKQLIVDAQAEF